MLAGSINRSLSVWCSAGALLIILIDVGVDAYMQWEIHRLPKLLVPHLLSCVSRYLTVWGLVKRTVSILEQCSFHRAAQTGDGCPATISPSFSCCHAGGSSSKQRPSWPPAVCCLLEFCSKHAALRHHSSQWFCCFRQVADRAGSGLQTSPLAQFRKCRQ